MKKEYTYIIIFLFIYQVGLAQLFHVHTHINNNDRKTRAKLTRLILMLQARNALLTKTNAALAEAVFKHKTQLGLQYTKNRYDRKDGFLANAAGSASLSLATSVLSNYPKLPYMTRTKREYLQSKAMEKSILLGLQLMSTRKIKSGKRQEIYRLRSELIREFSKNDRESRKILLFSAVGLAAVNYETFLELSKTMNIIEIAL